MPNDSGLPRASACGLRASLCAGVKLSNTSKHDDKED